MEIESTIKPLSVKMHDQRLPKESGHIKGGKTFEDAYKLNEKNNRNIIAFHNSLKRKYYRVWRTAIGGLPD